MKKNLKLTKEQIDSLNESVANYNNTCGRSDGWHCDIAIDLHTGDCWDDWNGPNEWREYDDPDVIYVTHLLLENAYNDEWDPDIPSDSISNPRIDINRAIAYIESGLPNNISK